MNKEYQNFVNHIVYQLYLLSAKQRTTSSVLHIVYQHQQEKGKETFFKSGCDYIAFVQIVDHLLQQLDIYQGEHTWYCPLWKGVDPHNAKSFRLDHTIIGQDHSQVRFRKFFAECSTQMLKDYKEKAILCSEHMFQRKPSSIECIDLTTGELHVMNSA